MIGQHLSHYEILSAIGKGGMGEVWRARDTKLGREVAIKTLPSEFAQDADRLARFEREARLLASLNHPNIAAIHGLEEHSGARFLVLELVEGETLADRIRRGPLPVDESLPIALQIAEALEAAHGKGVLHRDLKPANIKVTPEGRVKVLDFGLAKAIADVTEHPSLSNSPTLSMAATGQGVILGTAAYMSPEQARGETVDTRADVWAFGCVLYETLTGRAAFDGPTVSDILAAVLRADVEWDRLPEGLHPRVRLLLERCLEKTVRNRYTGVADARVDVEKALADPEGLQASRAAARASKGFAFGLRHLVGAAALVTVAAVVTAILIGRGAPADTPAWASGPIRFPLSAPENTTFYPGFEVPFEVSPDGRQIVFTARAANGRPQLWLRPLDSEDARPLAGTEGAQSPFWSPDGGWIGFFAGDAIRQVRVSGGEPRTIARVGSVRTGVRQAAWGDDGRGGDGTIVFQRHPGQALSQVSVQDGALRPATTLREGEAVQFWPRFLEDGRHFIYWAGSPGEGILYLGSVDGTDSRPLMEFETEGRNLTVSTLGSMPGYILYVWDGVLYARPFDDDALEFSGEAFRLLDGIPYSSAGRAPFSVSANGVLAYSFQPLGERLEFRWFERDGTVSAPVTPPARYNNWDLAPGESRIVFSRYDEEGRRNIWVRDFESGVEEPVTFDGDSMAPLWAPGAESLVFTSARGQPPNLFRASLTDGSEERLTDAPLVQHVTSWDAGRNWIVYEQQEPDSGGDLWRFALDDSDDDGQAAELPGNTPSDEFDGRVSPDGRWIAYVSDASGTHEVILAAFPSGPPRQTISAGGGSHPRWRGDSGELYYVSADQQLMAVAVGAAESGLNVGARETLFALPPGAASDLDQPFPPDLYAPASNGRRFLFLVRTETQDARPIHVVVNWLPLMNP